MSSVRLRRLQSDFERLSDYLERHPRLRLLEAEGQPPEKYEIEYRIRSMRRSDGELKKISRHRVEIALPRNYPRTAPSCRMLTPIFHPNIAPHAICVGDHWNAGEPLWSIVARIGEIIAYQSYNTKSPLNGEAAKWAVQNRDALPLDSVSMLLDDSARESAASEPESKAPKPASDTMGVQCPHCQVRYRIARRHAGRKVRCRNCEAVLKLPEIANP